VSDSAIDYKQKPVFFYIRTFADDYTIYPDDRALEAFGGDMMDLSRRAPSAKAGYDQGRAMAGVLGAFWR
jgi:hypothetical protein